MKLGNGRFDIDSSDPLNDTADRVKTNACKFKELCGNNFVYQTEEGASVYVAMQFAFTSQVHEQTFKRSVGAGLEHTFNVNGVSIKVGAKIDTAVTKLNRITRDNGSLEVVAYQKGGDVTGLARIFSGENSQTVPAFSCSLNNLKACTSALDKIVQYIASKEFAEGVKTSPAILNYAYRPYWEVDPDVPEELKTSEVSTEIENARFRLAEAYEKITIDQKTLAKTLQLDLATNRQQELVGLATQLQTDAENVQKAALICFSDLEACVSNTNQVLANVAYDRKIIEPNAFTDGLVAYYPFNTNVLDESGNDHHGTINGYFSNNDFSISFYFSLNSTASSALLSKRKSCQHGKFFDIRSSSKRINFEIDDSSTNYVVLHSNKINVRKWYFYTAIKNEINIRLYINGNLVNEQPIKGVMDISNNATLGFSNSPCIGRDGTTMLKGSIDEFRIYNRVLNDSEIQQLYNNASNQTKNCKAKLLDQKLEVPCVRVPNVIVGGADIYSVDLINTPFSKRFDVDLKTLKKHTFQDSCLAKYNFNTGSLNLPCVNVPNDRDYVMKMQQRTGTLVFDLIDSQ